MSNGNAKRTTGERQAQRLAHELRFGKGAYQDRINAGGRRIDAAIRRAVKAEHHRMNVIAWNLYQKAHDFSPDQANEILSAITPTPAAHQTGKVKRTNIGKAVR